LVTPHRLRAWVRHSDGQRGAPRDGRDRRWSPWGALNQTEVSFTRLVAYRLHLKKPTATGFFTLAASGSQAALTSCDKTSPGRRRVEPTIYGVYPTSRGAPPERVGLAKTPLAGNLRLWREAHTGDAGMKLSEVVSQGQPWARTEPRRPMITKPHLGCSASSRPPAGRRWPTPPGPSRPA